ncbi:MAG: FKBP-type peptidyl-prolyl cis-trans isomerase, partial [Gammaproteobacteria bacterium]|nr:FKBP-type peptidyl-prolyl cis-trans isomerase [Gammaproteobacteria bacterium]
MTQKVVEQSKVVAFTYSIADESGKVLEQSDLPIEYVHGSGNGQMFPQVEAAMVGKKNGDSVTVTLSPDEAFGQFDPDLSFTDEMENIADEYRFVGARPRFQNEKGETMELTVTKIEDGKI